MNVPKDQFLYETFFFVPQWFIESQFFHTLQSNPSYLTIAVYQFKKIHYFHSHSQVRGHQRVPSDSKEFHEVTKRDAQTQLEVELDKLLKTTNDELKPFLTDEMARFSSLFRRFLSEEGPSVDWEKIQKLPEDAVRHYATLSSPKEDQVSEYLVWPMREKQKLITK